MRDSVTKSQVFFFRHLCQPEAHRSKMRFDWWNGELVGYWSARQEGHGTETAAATARDGGCFLSTISGFEASNSGDVAWLNLAAPLGLVYTTPGGLSRRYRSPSLPVLFVSVSLSLSQ